MLRGGYISLCACIHAALVLLCSSVRFFILHIYLFIFHDKRRHTCIYIKQTEQTTSVSRTRIKNSRAQKTPNPCGFYDVNFGESLTPRDRRIRVVFFYGGARASFVRVMSVQKEPRQMRKPCAKGNIKSLFEYTRQSTMETLVRSE